MHHGEVTNISICTGKREWVFTKPQKKLERNAAPQVSLMRHTRTFRVPHTVQYPAPTRNRLSVDVNQIHPGSHISHKQFWRYIYIYKHIYIHIIYISIKQKIWPGTSRSGCRCTRGQRWDPPRKRRPSGVCPPRKRTQSRGQKGDGGDNLGKSWRR